MDSHEEAMDLPYIIFFVPPNINKKDYRLADMSMQPDGPAAYPDPDESAAHEQDRVDMAEFGTALMFRSWQGSDGLIEQFAFMLNVTPTHPDYARCQRLKGQTRNFEQVYRTDTWHSSIHSHQYFINCEEDKKEVHEELRGGVAESNSRRTVNGAFKKYYNELLYDPFQYLERWEAGKDE